MWCRSGSASTATRPRWRSLRSTPRRNERVRMTELFDGYRDNYRDVVQSSIDFSGLPHDFFMRAKADLLGDLIAQRLRTNTPETLDAGSGLASLPPLLHGIVGRFRCTDATSAG